MMLSCWRCFFSAFVVFDRWRRNVSSRPIEIVSQNTSHRFVPRRVFHPRTKTKCGSIEWQYSYDDRPPFVDEIGASIATKLDGGHLLANEDHRPRMISLFSYVGYETTLHSSADGSASLQCNDGQMRWALTNELASDAVERWIVVDDVPMIPHHLSS